jgi:threonine synthase
MGVLAKYGSYLPLTEHTPMVNLEEGNTPLVHAPRLGKLLGCEKLYLKLEGCNPTGSFKDRGMVVAVAKASEEGAEGVICASTGNTSASAAAYAARVNLPAVVLVPEGNISLGKLAQAMIYGAKVLAIEGSFDLALNIVRAVGDEGNFAIVNSINPYRIEGQKTSSFEIIEKLGKAPDILAIPVGNAGNITAYWKGFNEALSSGMATNLPKMVGFQAAGSAPIVENKIIDHPETVATAIRIGNPASWASAVAAREESGGFIDSVTDDEILDAYRNLAQLEGVFGEPASASSVAGLFKSVRNGKLNLSESCVVCVITGSGLKDPDTAVKCGAEIYHLAADELTIRRWLGGLRAVR